MKNNLSHAQIETLSTISKGRHRTNLFKNYEQRTLAFLVQHLPSWMSPNKLTFIGFIGSLITMLSFILAKYVQREYLLIGVLGFAINWFGDSLDGRFAYYCKQPRKWYGFALDITIDWITTILIGIGYVVYTDNVWELLGFGFVVMYGWAMITTLLKYKITDKYTIDTGLFGPTEARIIISLILVLEVLFKDSIIYSAIFACVFLFIVDIIDTLNLLHLANEKDIAEKAK
jgi:hypothetical protein